MLSILRVRARAAVTGPVVGQRVANPQPIALKPMKKRYLFLFTCLPGILLAQGSRPDSDTGSDARLGGIILLLLIAVEWLYLRHLAKKRSRSDRRNGAAPAPQL